MFGHVAGARPVIGINRGMSFNRPARLALALLACSAGLAVAGDRPYGVVELFTSQGCNSCPPADDNLAALAKRGDVITLGYHVNYWDYLGWRDTLATPENTARQNEYKKSFQSRSVYTPQAVVNGRVHVNGAQRQALEGALSSLSGNGDGMDVSVDIERRGDTVVITTGDDPEGREAHVTLVYYDQPKSIEVDGGENDGKRILYVNPVTRVQTAGMWHGKTKQFELPASEFEKNGAGGCAVLLQAVAKNGGPGAILGAANLPAGK